MLTRHSWFYQSGSLLRRCPASKKWSVRNVAIICNGSASGHCCGPDRSQRAHSVGSEHRSLVNSPARVAGSEFARRSPAAGCWILAGEPVSGRAASYSTGASLRGLNLPYLPFGNPLFKVMKNSKAWHRKHALRIAMAKIDITKLRHAKRNRVQRSHPILEDILSQVLLQPLREEQI